MRAETELFKDKIEVSLDGRQVFYLFFGGAVIASLVFVLGVMVGKRVEARAHIDSQPATSAAKDPLAALDQLSQKGDLAFPSALAGASDAPLGEIDQVLAARIEARARAKSDARPAAKAKPDARPAAKAEAKPAAKAEAKPDAKAEAKPDAKPAAKAEAKPEADKHSADIADEDSADKAEPSRSESRFTLQLSSFRDRAEADSFYAKLTQAGYHPYIVEAEVPDKGTWYRVRLGGYDSYDAAILAKKEFEASQQIIAYVTRLKK